MKTNRALLLIPVLALTGCDQAAPRSTGPAAAVTSLADSLSTTLPPPEAVPPVRHPDHAREVAPLLEEFCLSCHSGPDAEAGVDLEVLAGADQSPGFDSLLVRVAGVLRSESMPPEDEPRPDVSQRETLEAWLDDAVGAGNRALSRGRPTIRRLNRSEYNNTIRDLLGLDLHLAGDFPADDVGYGFDNIADVLATTSLHVELELAAAETAIDAAYRDAESWGRITSPPADSVPLAFRRYALPTRDATGGKPLRSARPAVDPELVRQQRIYDILRAFADRAFRRPATHDELSRLLAVALSAERDGETPDSALRLALVAVLSSPHFFFRLERWREPGSSTSGDFGLASRLSYFLWGSMPDDELFGLAAHDELRRPEVLRSQALRMLADPRGRSLAVRFADQWLQIRRLAEWTPDARLFPGFDESLRAAMFRETQLFCQSIQEEDQSIIAFLNADYTFLNERLARHYGVAGINGEEFRRVSLAGTPRAGILTQASVLAVTSNPTRTSPVQRGKWILENILGTPPAPPPSGALALAEAASTASPAPSTLRERIERHRTDPNCAACHRRMDPLGFALENFDATGAWRTVDDGCPVDASGQLPAGRAFQGPDGLRAQLLARRNAFARCLTEKMLTFALGRGLDRSDRRHVDHIVTRLARADDRFRALVLAVVESDPFRETAIEGGNP